MQPKKCVHLPLPNYVVPMNLFNCHKLKAFVMIYDLQAKRLEKAKYWKLPENYKISSTFPIFKIKKPFLVVLFAFKICTGIMSLKVPWNIAGLK